MTTISQTQEGTCTMNALHPQTPFLQFPHQGIVIRWSYALAPILCACDSDLTVFQPLCVVLKGLQVTRAPEKQILLFESFYLKSEMLLAQVPLELTAQRSKVRGVCPVIEMMLVNHLSFWKCTKSLLLFLFLKHQILQWLRILPRDSSWFVPKHYGNRNYNKAKVHFLVNQRFSLLQKGKGTSLSGQVCLCPCHTAAWLSVTVELWTGGYAACFELPHL